MEINKIILIGNGFDLAHGLKTGYGDFINHLWREEIVNLQNEIHHLLQVKNHGNKFIYDSNLLSFQVNFTIQTSRIQSYFYTIKEKLIVGNKEKLHLPDASINELTEQLLKDKVFKSKNSFLEKITLTKNINGWVDFEQEFFDELKKTENVTTLNKEFNQIKEMFEQYLHTEILPEIEKITLSDDIKDFIKCNIENRELSTTFIANTVANDLSTLANESEKISLLKSINQPSSTFTKSHNIKPLNGHQLINSFTQNFKIADNDLKSERQKLTPIKPIKPENIFFINFNYTNTFEKYKHSESTSIYIHGKLKDENNPIILGYGDERSDEYKALELKSNEYLKNIKSFTYSNTSNYKNLMRIIESKYYQIVILGHSCGMSDRVLLSTLFEHENCISIKPHYYKNEEKNTDSFQDTIMNISRSFIHKTKMRDLVVDKTETKPYSVVKAEIPALEPIQNN